MGQIARGAVVAVALLAAAAGAFTPPYRGSSGGVPPGATQRMVPLRRSGPPPPLRMADFDPAIEREIEQRKKKLAELEAAKKKARESLKRLEERERGGNFGGGSFGGGNSFGADSRREADRRELERRDKEKRVRLKREDFERKQKERESIRKASQSQNTYKEPPLTAQRLREAEDKIRGQQKPESPRKQKARSRLAGVERDLSGSRSRLREFEKEESRLSKPIPPEEAIPGGRAARKKARERVQKQASQERSRVRKLQDEASRIKKQYKISGSPSIPNLDNLSTDRKANSADSAKNPRYSKLQGDISQTQQRKKELQKKIEIQKGNLEEKKRRLEELKKQEARRKNRAAGFGAGAAGGAGLFSGFGRGLGGGFPGSNGGTNPLSEAGTAIAGGLATLATGRALLMNRAEVQAARRSRIPKRGGSFPNPAIAARKRQQIISPSKAREAGIKEARAEAAVLRAQAAKRARDRQRLAQPVRGKRGNKGRPKPKGSRSPVVAPKPIATQGPVRNARLGRDTRLGFTRYVEGEIDEFETYAYSFLAAATTLGLGFFSSEGLRPTRGGIELIEGYVAAAFIAVGFTTFYLVSSTDVNGNITGGWLGGQLQKPIPGYKRNLAQRRYRQNDLDPAVLVLLSSTAAASILSFGLLNNFLFGVNSNGRRLQPRRPRPTVPKNIQNKYSKTYGRYLSDLRTPDYFRLKVNEFLNNNGVEEFLNNNGVSPFNTVKKTSTTVNSLPPTTVVGPQVPANLPLRPPPTSSSSRPNNTSLDDDLFRDVFLVFEGVVFATILGFIRSVFRFLGGSRRR